MNELKKKEQSQEVNRYQKWIDMARAVDQWRIFPRIFI